MSLPEEHKALLHAAKESYDKTPEPYDSSKQQLILNTPTLDVFLNESAKTIIVAIRGTRISDFADLKADASIAFNRLKNSARYMQDKDDFREVVKVYPPSQYTYVLTGHSLGGAILAQFLRDFPFISFARSVAWNGAVQPGDVFRGEQGHNKYYVLLDPLYRSGGFLLKRNIKTVNGKLIPDRNNWRRWIYPKSSWALKAHKLENF